MFTVLTILKMDFNGDGMSDRSRSSSKAPLVSHQLSICDSHSSGESPPSPAELSMHNHDYENPRDLQKDFLRERSKLDSSRKKNNLIYEPSIPLRPMKDGRVLKDEETEMAYIPLHDHHDRLYKFLFVLLFLLSAGAFTLSALAAFGIIGSNCGCSIDGRPSISGRYAYSEDSNTSAVHIPPYQALQRNLTHLTHIVIPMMEGQIKQMQTDMKSGIQGPPGVPGPPGPQGPKGAGDLSQCQYKNMMVEAKIEAPYTQVKVHTKTISASNGHTILSASCATKGGAEHGLFTEIGADGEPKYRCVCGGKAVSAVFSTEFEQNMIKCWIHWWECPLRS